MGKKNLSVAYIRQLAGAGLLPWARQARDIDRLQQRVVLTEMSVTDLSWNHWSWQRFYTVMGGARRRVSELNEHSREFSWIRH